jgi:hypothetical protein
MPPVLIVGLLSLLVGTTASAAQESDSTPAADTVRQRDVMDLLAAVLGKEPDTSDTLPQGAVITLLPAFGANPTVGVLVGVSANVVGRLGPDIVGGVVTDESTNLSTLSASVNVTTKHQFNLLLRSNVFFRGNSGRLEGDWRYLDTNQPTYGLGPAQPEARESPMDFNQLRLYETGYLETVPNLLIGVGYHLDYHFGIVDQNANAGLPSPFLEYNGGVPITQTTSSGFSLNLGFDTRDNPVNPSRGFYTAGSFRVFPTWLGSDASWQALIGEARTYMHPGGPRGTLAFWGYGWFSFGRAPYLDLPAIGWDYSGRMGRAYAQGRIRATDLIYAEVEYRLRLTANGFWGAAAFVNLTSVTDPLTGTLQSPDPGVGAGLRIKLNKHSNTNITIDFAVGAEGSNGVFLGTGEAF